MILRFDLYIGYNQLKMGKRVESAIFHVVNNQTSVDKALTDVSIKHASRFFSLGVIFKVSAHQFNSFDYSCKGCPRKKKL